MIPPIEKLRNRQVKNFLTLTMLSLGMPMILMGDEVRRTQPATTTLTARTTRSAGSIGRWYANTPTCIDFVSLLIGRRRLRDMEPEKTTHQFDGSIAEAIKEWHGVRLNQPDWGDGSHSIALRGSWGIRGLCSI